MRNADLFRDEWAQKITKEKKKKTRRRRRRIKHNRSKESCVLITQFHVLSVRSTSPAFVEAERSQLYHLRDATGSVIQPRIVSDQFATSGLARTRRSLLSFISHGHYLHSREYPRLTPPADYRRICDSQRLSGQKAPRFSHNLRRRRSYFQILSQRSKDWRFTYLSIILLHTYLCLRIVCSFSHSEVIRTMSQLCHKIHLILNYNKNVIQNFKLTKNTYYLKRTIFDIDFRENENLQSNLQLISFLYGYYIYSSNNCFSQSRLHRKHCYVVICTQMKQVKPNATMQMLYITTPKSPMQEIHIVG